ncbi:MAG: c-type cytochrome [Nitrospirae bacterium]|nr:c-type cytochrome [Nitrospirota bacterium]MCL5976974.1 c-type cytochrome [Nitrospirota bacterium]
MKKIVILIVFSVFALIFNYAFAQTAEHVHKPHPHKHKEYAKVKNPIPMTEDSIVKGKGLYGKHCVSCHGESSKGSEKTDLTDNLWIHGDSDGEIFHVITDGTKGPTPMKGFKKELTKEMRWHLVNYINSLKKSEGDRR